MSYLIVGLGNPGKDYAKTRHNLGFRVLDQLIEKYLAVPTKTKFMADTWTAHPGKTTTHLLKAKTFMNLSGHAVAPFAKAKKIPVDHIIVIHDDIDLPVGAIRVAKDRGAGGHNGVKSLIDSLGSKNFFRLRLGVGRPAAHQAIDTYVLGRPSREEEKIIALAVDNAIIQLESIFLK